MREVCDTTLTALLIALGGVCILAVSLMAYRDVLLPVCRRQIVLMDSGSCSVTCWPCALRGCTW